MMRRVVLIAGLVLATASGAAAPAAAASDPGAVINRLGNEGLAALGPNIAPTERLARFRQLFDRDFDTGIISRFILGRYWRLASGPQREEFRQLFTQYISMVYSQRLAPYEGSRLSVLGTRGGPDGTLVQSRIERPGGQPVAIDWRMTPIGDTWKIVDVIVEGVSMAATQREEFAAVIQRDGGAVDGLLSEMRTRIQAGPGKEVAGDGAGHGMPAAGGNYGSTRPTPGAALPPPR